MEQKILIVDDKPANLLALENLLRKVDVQVVRATSGNEALSATLNHLFALAILDVQMPGMDGYELAELMREGENTAKTPIIFLSAAFSDDIHVFRGYEAGGVDFITKPLQPQILLSKVRVFLELDRHRQALNELVMERTSELQERNAQLKTEIAVRRRAEEDHRRLSQVVEQSSEGIMITDGNGVIQYVNPAFEAVTGHASADAVGQRAGVLRGGGWEAVNKQLWRTISQGCEWVGQVSCRQKCGKVYQAEVTISPVRSAGDEPACYVVAERDITVETELATQLRQSQKMEAIGQLAGGVAHDFNNMLTIIMGNGQLLQLKANHDERLMRSVDSILKAAERASSLTRQLLAFSRKQVIETRVVNLNALIEDLLKMLKRLIGEDITLTTSLGEGSCRVKIDPGQMEQVLMNLVVNARDAMSDGGELFISTRLPEVRQSDGDPSLQVVLEVRDTGCGMDKATLSHIFEPFFTTKEVGKGTGLGLATVYGIINQLDGEIEVESQPGVGTTFRILLPLSLDDVAATAEKQVWSTDARCSETVLIAEDEDDVRELTREILEAHSYRVLAAAHPEAALALATSYKGEIHLLLTDVVMPGYNGAELAKRVRRVRPEIAVIYTSGYTDREILTDERLGICNGHFLQKPFSPSTLTSKLRAVLDDNQQPVDEAPATS